MRNLVRANKLKIIFALFLQLISLGANAESNCSCLETSRRQIYMDCGPGSDLIRYPSYQACFADAGEYMRRSDRRRQDGGGVYFCSGEWLYKGHKAIQQFKSSDSCEYAVRNIENKVTAGW